MNSKMTQLFNDQRSVHVLYPYNGMEKYIEQAVRFIQDGITAGDCVIFIENDRNYPIIYKELSRVVTQDQLKFLHHVNNFDFYYSSGSYHPPSITNYFNEMVQPYVEEEVSFRSWAHVEWATMKDPLLLIEEFEKVVDETVNQLAFPLICAYDGDKMPDHLRTILMETHPYILMEDDVILSEQYQHLV
ncbi:MEDS domain-containing protein [Mesobacillus foraminis]|uniref:MEDS domain-containing protein n=1 Tax=Mesobacillus foraminis TaxID=279826 RepID=UPI001BE6BDE1|nr:MEDS domain-containing protein [Mesobacillus foraminis]MBT2756724.1 MEDS domain-containing protein [Mesobacillus foraminis]